MASSRGKTGEHERSRRTSTSHREGDFRRHGLRAASFFFACSPDDYHGYDISSSTTAHTAAFRRSYPSVSPVVVYRKGLGWFLCVCALAGNTFSASAAAAAPFVRDRSSLVTSAIPPHLVNTKHGRRTDIRWSSASQADGEN